MPFLVYIFIRRSFHTSVKSSDKPTSVLLEGLDSVLRQLEQQSLKVKFADSYAELIRRFAESKSLSHAKRLHSHIVSAGHGDNGYLAGLLVHLYVKCGDLPTAQTLFDSIPRKKSVLWNIMIGEYDRIGSSRKAWELFQKMDTEPDKVSFVLALRVCGALGYLEQGESTYQRILQSQFQGEIKLHNGAISMFSKCGSLDSAKSVFDRMVNRDVITWNSIITAFTQYGKNMEALVLYKRMLQEGFQPNAVTFSGVTSACKARQDVVSVQACLLSSEFSRDVVVQNALVSACARCGDLDSSRKVFDGIHPRDLVSWNSMLTAYAQRGYAQETLELYQEMDVEPDAITFASVLGACSLVNALETGREVHARVARSRFKSDSMVETALVHMYSKFGFLDVAKSVFDEIDVTRNKDPSAWNAMMSGFVQHGRPREALALLERMDAEQVRPDRVTFLSALGACSALEDLEQGFRVHERTYACGMENDNVVQTALFHMYAKCKRVELAREMFDKMQDKTVVPWNVMISVYAQADDKLLNRKALDLYGNMDSEGVQPDEITFTHLLSACVSLGALEEAKAIHERVSASRCKTSGVLDTAILTMYAKFNMLDVARSEFDKMDVKHVTSWNAMISAYAQHGFSRKSLLLYHQMNHEGVKPDGRTFVSVLGACSNLLDLAQGKLVETQAISMGYEAVETAVLGLYSKCGELRVARDMFERLKHKTVVSWNSMMAAYVQSGDGKEALALYERMRAEGELPPDDITYSAALGACSSHGGSTRGAEIHATILKSGLKFDVFLETAIVNMYGKCGELETARRLFEEMRGKNVVTWSVMVGAYIQHGLDREALELYLRMDAEGFQPSEVTLAGVLAACSRLGCLQEGKAIHARIQATPTLKSSLFLQNGLLNMYAKCGCLSVAKSLFSQLQQRDSFSWNTIIVGHAHHGDVADVLQLQAEMVLDGVQPDYVTFACILLACSHAGFVERGRSYFLHMETDFGVDRDAEHFLCIVDLLARAGRLQSAEELIHDMPYEPPALAWTTLLGCSQVQADPDRGVRYAENAAVLEPDSSSSYVLLWNIYTRHKASEGDGMEVDQDSGNS